MLDSLRRLQACEIWVHFCIQESMLAVLTPNAAGKYDVQSTVSVATKEREKRLVIGSKVQETRVHSTLIVGLV